jgi:hypothetical protein
MGQPYPRLNLPLSLPDRDVPDHGVVTDPAGGRRRLVGYAVAWSVAASVAVTVGVVSVTTMGDTIRDRGPLGNEVARLAELEEGEARPDPGDPRVTQRIEGEYGSFVVACQGAVALGVAADGAAGWRVVSYEPGPDDDVDAVFSNRRRSVELEVFCNRGQPTLAEIERKTLPED